MAAAGRRNAIRSDEGVAAAEREQPAAGRLEIGCQHQGPHTGVLFVHGIGQQVAGETLRDWGSPIVRAISDVRLERGLEGDPVVSARLHPEDGLGLHIEIDALNGAHWVLTEAWWADRVTAPSFSVMAAWLGPGGALARIGDTVLGYSSGAGPTSRVVNLLRRVGLRVFLIAVASLVLFLYGLLRVVARVLPFGPLKSGALTGAIDNFMLEWFGDVYVLIADRAQSAEIRRRFETAVRALRDAGCDRIVVVAHSGGSIVSFMAMAGEGSQLPRIDRLVTHGEGLNLAWRLLEDDPTVSDRYPRLYRSPWLANPDLIWNDVWATQDPAPNGPLVLPRPVSERPERPRAWRVWNRASIRSDHGTYWLNDEEWVIPLIRLIEGRLPFGDDSTFHPDRGRRTAAVVRRRDRVSLLALARQAAIGVPAVALTLALVADAGGSLRAVGASIASWLGSIVVFDAVGDALGALRAGLEPGQATRAAAWATTAGVTVLATLLAVVPLVVAMATGHIPRGRSRRPLVAAVAGTKLLLGSAGIAAVLLLAESALRGAVAPAAAAVPWSRDEVVSAALATTALLAIGGLLLVSFGRFIAAGADRILRTAEARFKALWLRILEIGLPVRRTMLWRVFRNAVLIVVGVGIVVAPLFALIVRADVGELVLAGGAVLLVAAAVGRLASWRWNAWDERERLEARREHGRRLGRWHVLWQSLLLLGALVAGTFGVAFNILVLMGVASVLALAVVVTGVAIDIASAEDSAGQPPRGGRTRNLLRMVYAQRM